MSYEKPLLKGYVSLAKDYDPERETPCVHFGTSRKCMGNAHMDIIGSLGISLKACDKCGEYSPH